MRLKEMDTEELKRMRDEVTAEIDKANEVLLFAPYLDEIRKVVEELQMEREFICLMLSKRRF